MVYIETIGRNFDYDAPSFVDDFLKKEKSVQDKVGSAIYQANLSDFRYMILTGFWTRNGSRIVEAITPLWTEDIGLYYYNLGYPFQDPTKRFLKTLYWFIVREYTIDKAPVNKAGGKCQHPNCLYPRSHHLNVHHGSIVDENYVCLGRGFQPIVGREHLHDGMLTVLCEVCHTRVTEQSRTAKMSRPRSITISSTDNPELFKRMMSNLSSNKIVNKRDVEPPSMGTIGDLIKYKQEKKDK